MLIGTCDRCKFWGLDGHAMSPTQAPGRRAGRVGPCHRFPPQVDSEGRSNWPQTSAKDACGEYRSELISIGNVHSPIREG